MDTMHVPPDFSEFLRLLNSSGVEYLLIGGYAVIFYGYPRPTGDMDIWVAVSPQNAKKLVSVFKEFAGYETELTDSTFLEENKVIRMGVPPLRLEVLTGIDGVRFEECYANRVTTKFDGVDVSVIGLKDLRQNKAASGRLKDLSDLEYLPDGHV